MDKKMETTIMENQMEKKMENEMKAREYVALWIPIVWTATNFEKFSSPSYLQGFKLVIDEGKVPPQNVEEATHAV